MRIFLIIWSGQLVSLLGSSITSFALGVWVYERTGSVTQFALITVAAQLPTIVLSPLVGALVDRWNRRVVMITADTGAFLATLTLVLLLSAGVLEVWHIIILAIWASACNAFQSIAYTTSITLLLPREKYGRATGMMQLAQGMGQILAPVLGGLLLVLVELKGVILIDMISFAVAVTTLFLVRIPDVDRKETGKKSLIAEVSRGWQYLKKRRELLALLFYFSSVNFLFGMAMTSFLPMILGVASKPAAGTILSVGGVGTLLGSLLMSWWGGPKRHVLGIFAFHGLCGLGMLLMGAGASIPLISIGIFLFSLGMPIVGGCSQVIWLSRVAPEIQGRVFALRRMVGWAMMPLAYLAAGPLCDQLFEPLMAEGGYLATTVIGSFMGTGTGRGIALLIFLTGLLVLTFVLIASKIPQLKNLKTQSEESPVAQA